MVLRVTASLALLSSCAYASDWHGISPDLQLKLSAVSSFTCDNGQRLDLSRLNDNYCDCQDGSDEPGTSACSHTSAVFHCINAGFFPADVPTSHVNDGICDCCDGSDEYASGASCASTCDAKMETFKASKQDLIAQVDAGLKDRVTLAAEAEKLWDEEELKKQQIDTKAASLRVMVEQLEARKEEDEKLEREEKQKRITDSKNEILTQLGLVDLTKEQLLSIIVEIGREGVPAKQDLLPIIRKEREAAHEGEEELPKTPMDEKDEAFRERDEARQDETSRIEKLIEEKEKKEQEAKEALEAGEDGESAETEAEEEAKEEDLTLPEIETRPIDLLYEELAASERYEWVQAVLTRKRHDETKEELKEEEKKLTEAQKLLEKDYGVDHLFFALRDKCVESEAGQYTYKICFFGKATQDHTKLGDMEDIKGPESEGSAESADVAALTGTNAKELTFSKGQKCWNGPNRSMTVKLECGPEPMELYNIEEPSTCVYTAKLRTPAVCSEDDRERIMTFNDAQVAPHHIEIEVQPTL